jgi:hypothetical protein
MFTFELQLDPLTSRDLRDLDVVGRLADMVGYSFEQIALVAKIETQLAIRSLPELIVQGPDRSRWR